MKTNSEKLVKMSVQGLVSPPLKRQQFTVKNDGEPVILPGVGGITYNVKVGDSVMGWVGDHVEPGVSVKISGSNEKLLENSALNILTCIGNKARVVSGDAKGAEGFVTGKHGGIEHVLVYFDDETLEKLIIEDKILFKSWGLGLKIDELPEVKVMNLDPDLMAKLPLKANHGVLEIPVAGIIPPELMGSGLGSASAYSGDYDLTTADRVILEELGLANLRFGDFVALTDTDNSFGRCFKRGAVSIGVVVHSDCVLAGHGPGITTVFTSATGKIKPVVSKSANLVDYVDLFK